MIIWWHKGHLSLKNPCYSVLLIYKVVSRTGEGGPSGNWLKQTYLEIVVVVVAVAVVIMVAVAVQ